MSNPAVLEAFPEAVELFLSLLIAWVVYVVYEEFVRPWWKRRFGR
jgi:hypothetical protein